MIFLVHALLKVYGREAEAVREGERCVSFGGQLMEALVCADVCRRTCAVNCRRSSLSCCVGASFFVGKGVFEGGFVAVSLVGHRGGVWRSWLDVWDIV